MEEVLFFRKNLQQTKEPNAIDSREWEGFVTYYYSIHSN